MQTDPSIDFNMGFSFVAEGKSTMIQSLRIHFLFFVGQLSFITDSNVLVYLCGYRGLISKKNFHLPLCTACCMHTNFVRISNKHYYSTIEYCYFKLKTFFILTNDMIQPSFTSLKWNHGQINPT